MLYNYLIVAWRSLLRNKLTTVVNLAGLVTGITAALLISLFILDELKYDQHFRNKDRIYRVSSLYDHTGSTYHTAQTDAFLAQRLVQQLPEFEHVTRILPADEAFLFLESKAFKEVILYTDSNFTQVFNLTLLLGENNSCLAMPSSLLISKSTAIKLFGNNWDRKEILGQVLSIDNRIPLTITGVFEDLPAHTHFTSHLIASIPAGSGEWMSDVSKVYTYALVGENVSEKDIMNKVASLSSLSSTESITGNIRYALQPLTDIHLFSKLQDENALTGNVGSLYALSFVGLLLLIITVSNFSNLYTANALTRMKEIGIRKAIGAIANQVRLQFFSETLLITMLAIAASLIIVVAVLPFFGQVTGKEIAIDSLLDPDVAALLSALGCGIALIAGSYPSLFMSRTQSSAALKGSKNKIQGAGWRKGLIVLQFTISGIMMVLSIVALKQSNLINNKSLGFDKDNTVTLANPYMLGSTDKIVSLKNELLATQGVEHVSVTGYTPSQTRWINQKITYPERDIQSNSKMNAAWLTVDEDFIETMGLILTDGRNFTDNHERDKEAIIINETAVSQFKLNENGKKPIGSQLSFADAENDEQHFTVVGVVHDFNFGSLHESIKPVIMKLGYHRFELVASISTAFPRQTTLSKMEQVWQRHLPAIPFQYSFVRDRYDQLHRADTAVGKVFSVFCGVTIVLSALGLFSIATYTIVSRTKEIGIRKVLGASSWSIASEVSRDFIVLVMTALLFALPASLFVARNWLSGFAYKTEISWWIFGATTLLILTVTIITLGYQSFKAATADPVKNLRAD